MASGHPNNWDGVQLPGRQSTGHQLGAFWWPGLPQESWCLRNLGSLSLVPAGHWAAPGMRSLVNA